MKESFIQRYISFVITHPWQIFILTLLVVMSAGSGGRFIEFTNDYRVFFSEENPELQAFEEMQNIYTKTDNVLFVIEPEGTDVLILAL